MSFEPEDWVASYKNYDISCGQLKRSTQTNTVDHRITYRDMD